MAADIQKYERQLIISGRYPQVEFAQGPANAVRQQSQLLREEAVKIEERVADNALAQGQNSIAENISRIEREHAGDPDNLKTALENYKSSFLEEMNDPEVADRLSIQFDRTGLVALERARDTQQKIIDDQAMFGALTSLDGIEKEIFSLSDSIFSDSPSTSQAAQSSLQEVLDRIDTTLMQKDSRGLPMFSAEQRLARLSQTKDIALSGAAIAWMDRQGDKDAALKTIAEGGLKLSLPNGEGGYDSIDVSEALSPKAMDVLKSEAKRQKSAQRAAIIKAQEEDELTQIGNQKSLLEFIEADGASFEEKIKTINEMDLKGKINSKFAVEARRYLSSAQKINAQTDDDAIAGIVSSIYDLNSISGDNEKEYLKGIQNIKLDIIRQRADGKISAADEKKLNKQLQVLTAAKVSDATEKVSSTLGEAKKIIETTLPPEKRGAAMRKVFHENLSLQEKEADPENKDPITPDTYKEKARAVVDETNKERRKKALETVTAKPAPIKTQATDTEAFLKQKGYSMADVAETAKKYGISEAQVIEKLRAKK